MAKQTMARPAAATTTSAARAARPPRRPASSVPAFGGWEVDKAAAPDYSLDFTTVRAARMHRRTKALSWSSFVDGNAALAVAGETTTTTPGGGGGSEEEEEKRQWSSAATSDADDDEDGQGRRQRYRTLRRLRSADDEDNRQPIQPGRAVAKGRNKFIKGYLFGCVGGQW